MSGELEKMQPGAQQTSGIHLWLVLWKAFYALQARAMADIECLGLCLSDFAILELLLQKGPMPVNEIGCKVKLTSGSITVAIDRLECELAALPAADRAMLSIRLHDVLLRLDGAERGGPLSGAVTSLIDAASDDEVFDFIDKELGVS